MDILTLPIEQLIPYARNPRRNDDAVVTVAASLAEFGWRQPIVVDEHMAIVVGHTRWAAAKRLGMTEVPVHVARGLIVEAATQKGERRSFVLPLVLREDGTRVPQGERNSDQFFGLSPVASDMTPAKRLEMLHRMIEPTLQRELRHRGVVTDEGSFTAELLIWIELT